jgi:hypothetical protein
VLLIQTYEPVKAGVPHTAMSLQGHPILTQLLVPDMAIKQWAGYYLSLMGHQVDKLPKEGVPWWGFQLVSGPFIGPFMIELREVVALRPTSPLVAALRWSPGEPIRTSIDELGDKWTSRDLKLAGQALPRLRGIAHATGRPDGTGEFWSEGSFRAALEPVVRELLAKQGAAKLEDVAAATERQPRALTRHCRQWTGLEWPRFVESVKACADLLSCTDDPKALHDENAAEREGVRNAAQPEDRGRSGDV